MLIKYSNEERWDVAQEEHHKADEQGYHRRFEPDTVGKIMNSKMNIGKGSDRRTTACERSCNKNTLGMTLYTQTQTLKHPYMYIEVRPKGNMIEG